MISRPFGFNSLTRWAALFSLLAVFAALAPGRVNGALASRDIRRYLKSYETITMDPVGIAEQVRAGGYVYLPLREGAIHLMFTPHDMRSPGHTAEETGPDGMRLRLEMPFADTYKGEVLGSGESQARFTFEQGRIEGLILTPEEWYFVEPVSRYEESAPVTELLVYRRSDILPEAIGECGTTLAHRIGRIAGGMARRALEAPGTLRIAQVATEADYEYVTALGDSTRANNEILQIMNQVSGIYETELEISLEVVYQHAWGTPSDPYSATDAGGILGEFRSHWAANFSSMPYDLAHMWTGKNMDGSTVGIAWLGVVCNSRSYSYGVSQRLTSAPGKYMVTAHEIGHNFGATHTDQANPPQPVCDSTIMNSSIGTSLSFCEFSRGEIADHLSGNSTCLTVAANPCDLNLDGTPNIADVQMLVNVILGSAGCPGGCDINRDGKTDVLDLQALCNAILGLRSCS